MKRFVKGTLVLIGWSIVLMVACIIAKPIIYSFTLPNGLIPIEYAIPAFIMALGVGVPLMYGAIALITPLVMATIEVLDHEH